MDDSIFLSLALDQVIVSAGLNSPEEESSILQHTGDGDQTFYVVTSDNYDITHQLEHSISGGNLDLSANDLDLTINFVSLDQSGEDIEQTYKDLNLGTADGSLSYEVDTLPKAITEQSFPEEPQRFVTSEDGNFGKSPFKIFGKCTGNASNKSDGQIDNLKALSAPDKTQNTIFSQEDCLPEERVQEYPRTYKNVYEPDEPKDSKNVWICEGRPELRFPSKSQRRGQKRPPPPPAPRVLPCAECAATFSVPSRLHAHVLAVHRKYRPHMCDECGKTFAKAFDLKKHKSIHDGTKPHQCTICKKSFTDSSNLKRHHLQHTLEKPYKCETCGKRYQQLPSLQRHKKESAAALLGPCGVSTTNDKDHLCKTCGKKFKSQSALVEHAVRSHENNTGVDFKTYHISDLGRNVDALVYNMLSEENDQKKILTVKQEKSTEDRENLNNKFVKVKEENLFQVELINEIEGLASEIELSVDKNTEHTVKDHPIKLEYLNGSIDNLMNFNNFRPQNLNLQTNNLNVDSIAVVNDLKNNFDPIALNETVNDHLNFESISVEKFPDELLNLTEDGEIEITTSQSSNLEPSQVVVNECATIFESDVDLESSTHLAANLNQLIAENNVQFVSTEDDDTFIINLDSTIDAEQLSDLLNIGIEIVDQSSLEYVKSQTPQDIVFVKDAEKCLETDNLPPGDTVDNIKIHTKKTIPFYNCKICMKTFKRKENYISHLGTHNSKLSRHKCEVCNERFAYRSTLNKHVAAAHVPRVLPSHACAACPKRYGAAWMLKNHQQRDHAKLASYRCSKVGCGKKFYKKCDFDYHQRVHSNVRPYKCALCSGRFTHASHLARHRRNTDCTHPSRKGRATRTAVPCPSEMSTELLSDIDDLLKSKMNTSAL